MKLHSFACDEAEPHELFASLSRMPYSLFFDSADQLHELGRYSFITFQPVEMIESKNGKITVTNREQQLSFRGQPFQIVRDRVESYGLDKESREDLPPFQGGAAGFFGYDLVRSLETLPEETTDNPAMPDMAVGIYDQVFAWDHQKQKGVYMVHASDDRIAALRHQHFMRLATSPLAHPASGGMVERDGQWYALHMRDEYESAIQRVIDYIHAGDIFQANLSQRFEADLPAGFDPWEHYLTLRRVNAAPFAAYMNFGGVTLSSASPERFLYVKNRQVETRPIKGTAPRHEEESLDQFFRNQLENSEKDRAENTMIVDLLRNDLSKVCEDHSIDVPRLCGMESFAQVHHLVSIVTGTLRADQTPADLLEACFPGGSITGAPKVRAMQIIEELEKTRRGPYCGAMGYIGFNGAMDTSIAIRTLVYDGHTVSFNAGGGIVADSASFSEYDETMVKAEAIFKSFEIYLEQKTAGNRKAKTG